MLFRTLAATMIASIASVGLADEVIWNYNNQAIATGTGCSPADTFIVTAGPEVSVVFSQLGVNLGDEFAPNSARTNCSVRIPVKISRGQYIGELTQTFLYGITKSPGANGSITARATFFDLPAAQFVDKFQVGRRADEPLLEKTLRNDYRVNKPSWCTGRRSLAGEYKMNLAINGSRPHAGESIVIQMDGADIKFEAIAGFYSCSL